MRKFLSFLGWMLGIFIVLSFLMVLGGIAALLQQGLNEDGPFNVKTDRAVAVIELDGEILSSEKFNAALRKQVKNDQIKAIVVRIDTPGGAVGASEEMYLAIKEADKKKPVICAMSSVAASGGLYAAMGCRKVVTNKGTLTGSIGVVMMMPNVTTVMNKVGVDMTVIKSGKFKDSGSPFREVTPEDRQVMQGLVDTVYQQFVSVVAEARNLPVEEVAKFADGRIIVGEEAVKLGIADAIGNVETAARMALEAAGISGDPEIVQVKKRKGLSALFEDISESGVKQWLGEAAEARLLYRAFM